jgi:hypothetical protein
LVSSCSLGVKTRSHPKPVLVYSLLPIHRLAIIFAVFYDSISGSMQKL